MTTRKTQTPFALIGAVAGARLWLQDALSPLFFLFLLLGWPKETRKENSKPGARSSSISPGILLPFFPFSKLPDAQDRACVREMLARGGEEESERPEEDEALSLFFFFFSLLPLGRGSQGKGKPPSARADTSTTQPKARQQSRGETCLCLVSPPPLSFFSLCFSPFIPFLPPPRKQTSQV